MRGLVKKGIDAYLDFKSFKTKYPIVVIESDDWGSLRTKDIATRDQLNKISKAVENDAYTQLDSIATQEDLELLFEVLDSVKDRNGNPACLTANVCTANPDFQAIKDADFKQFYYKPFYETLEEYSNARSLFELWKEGNHKNVLEPQLHGREHLHALAWLEELKVGNKDLLRAFELETWGIPYKALRTQRRSNLQAALDYYDIDGEEKYHNQWIKDSVDIFEKAFGLKPKSFIPPAYTWHSKVHAHLKLQGIISVQGIKLQYQPEHNTIIKYNRRPHYIGQIDKQSQVIYAPRNAFFEPYSPDYTSISSSDWANRTLRDVDIALRQKKPAIIGSHRINFIGRLNPSNRDKNLKVFKTILQKIVKNYPNIRFMNSGELANLIAE